MELPKKEPETTGAARYANQAGALHDVEGLISYWVWCSAKEPEMILAAGPGEAANFYRRQEHLNDGVWIKVQVSEGTEYFRVRASVESDS